VLSLEAFSNWQCLNEDYISCCFCVHFLFSNVTVFKSSGNTSKWENVYQQCLKSLILCILESKSCISLWIAPWVVGFLSLKPCFNSIFLLPIYYGLISLFSLHMHCLYLMCFWCSLFPRDGGCYHHFAGMKEALKEKHVRVSIRMGTSKCFYVPWNINLMLL
jgi:hypothetical protein